MPILILTALAIGPALVLVHVIYAADRHEKEPVANILKYVLVGALSGLLAAMVEVVLFAIGDGSGTGPLAPVLFVLSMFFGIALVEESAKYLLLRACARKDRHINEPFDWVVYAVAVALGFATLENVFYVLSGGVSVGVARALTAVPAHAMNGTLMGDRLAKAAVSLGEEAKRQRRLAIIEPTFWHGLYDVCALGAGKLAHDGHPLGKALIVTLLGTIVLQWILSVRRVLAHYRAAPRSLLPPILYGVPRSLRKRGGVVVLSEIARRPRIEPGGAPGKDLFSDP